MIAAQRPRKVCSLFMTTCKTFLSMLLFLLSLRGAAQPGEAGGSKSKWRMVDAPLTTRWAVAVSPERALPEYPRPQMVREQWMNLNGLWDYGLTGEAASGPPTSYAGKILVPFCYESALSGIRAASIPTQRLWYHRTFAVPSGWRGDRVLLHLGAVNWDSTVAINGRLAGRHRGGYTAFEYDITDSLRAGDNDITISAWNPLLIDQPDNQVTGKQRDHANSIFYTAATGIWQTVWLEPVHPAHIVGLKLTPNIDSGSVHIEINSSSPASFTVSVQDGRRRVGAEVVGASGVPLDVSIKNPSLWSPEHPHLYKLRIKLYSGYNQLDRVTSYFAMRKISLGKDDQGRTRILLNNKPLLQIGVLDQGYWPDGIYTAPTDEALKYDIATAKLLGYNLIRKHAKVEPQRWYYWTDKLGMLVWQDMPQCFGAAPAGTTLSQQAKEQFKAEWQAEIAELYDSPSIVVWTTFNEGWGQHDTEEIASLTKQLDPSRLLDSATGGIDKGVGDLNDIHDYPGPGSERPESARAAVNGEFGGITESIEGHRWNQEYFGYGEVLKSRWLATKGYQDLLKKAYALAAERGSSAFVYTQITDVEQEINGLLTYDRAVIKFDPRIVKAANHGLFPSMASKPDTKTATSSDKQLFPVDSGARNWLQ